ncbi:MAG TPA: STAS domain-containing protein [Gammaproteobacteria bacterium]|nr:STAS domain-containing protein [Gammaproteobacteria bacterium]
MAAKLEFEVLGDGKFAMRGDLAFETVTDALEASKDLFDDYPRIEIDLSGITEGDSAGLALLLEWVNWAKYYVREIRYTAIPKQIRAIAEISEVEDMLRIGERWTGPIEKREAIEGT